jgi:DNA-binding XRE family transcriptional regulator
MVGVTRNTIHNIERGVSIPSVLIALRLAKTLQVSVSSIFEVQQRR